MGTKKRKSKKHSRRSKLDSKLFAILSGKTHRVVARSTKLSAARRKARGLIKRGSKHVSIRRGGQTFAVGRVSKKRTSKRRRSKKRTSRKGKRRSKKRVSRNGRRRRVSRNGRRRRHSRRHSR